ncbi:class I SAM-dependent methyltransferase [Micromonospora zhanjiangensis]|uniref:Class I SAM-dependent methyltransferase n=1 Tax=Micromonospora zhanjiangensis TaxID=1522057 RepID=A0ABV8KN44_9ACTN
MTTTAPATPTEGEFRQSYYGAGEHPDPEGELNRLRLQATASWPKEARVLREFGIRPDADLLEVGSGPGFTTELLLQEVPQGSVTCLELEPHQIAEATGYLQRRAASPPRIIEGSILDAPLPDASFDLVHARFVLQHVPDPVQALTEMRRLLRPGGRTVIVDIDDRLWGSVHPSADLPVIEKIIEGRVAMQAARGGDRLIGRRVPALLREAGYTDIRVEAVAVSSDELGMAALEPQLNVRSRYALMVDQNPEAAAAVAHVADLVDQFLALPDASAMLLVFMFTGVKPEQS